MERVVSWFLTNSDELSRLRGVRVEYEYELSDETFGYLL